MTLRYGQGRQLANANHKNDRVANANESKSRSGSKDKRFLLHCGSQSNAGIIFSRVDPKKGIHRVANFAAKTSSQWRISC
jgi:hypothetical protein